MFLLRRTYRVASGISYRDHALAHQQRRGETVKPLLILSSKDCSLHLQYLNEVLQDKSDEFSEKISASAEKTEFLLQECIQRHGYSKGWH